MIAHVVFLIGAGLVGILLISSLHQLNQLCASSTWWLKFEASRPTAKEIFHSILTVALAALNLALLGGLMWIFDVRHERQIFALSAWAYSAGVLAALHYKKYKD